MRTIIAIATALLMITVALPSATAESVSAEFTGGGARVNGVGLGVMCPNSCLNSGTFGEQPNVGGAHLVTSGAVFTNVIVSVSDDVYGQDAASSVCFWNPDGDNICDGDDYGAGTDCGVRALTDSPFAGDYVTVFAYAFAVTPDLAVCGASQGTITANFF